MKRPCRIKGEDGVGMYVSELPTPLLRSSVSYAHKLLPRTGADLVTTVLHAHFGVHECRVAFSRQTVPPAFQEMVESECDGDRDKVVVADWSLDRINSNMNNFLNGKIVLFRINTPVLRL